MNPIHLKKISGFSLIEMLVVIIILSILAAIALPMYSDYVEKGQLADAKVAATKLRQDFETSRLERPRGFQTAAQFQTEYNNSKNKTVKGQTATLYNFNITVAPSQGRPTSFTMAITPTKSSNKYGLRMTAAGEVLKCTYKSGTLAAESNCETF